MLKIKQDELKVHYIKVNLPVYYIFSLVVFIYSGCVSAELLGIHHNTNRLVIRYNAQDQFSVPEIHRILIENAHHQNLHVDVYVWDCQEKVDREYYLDIFYRKSKRRDVKQCKSRISSINQRLRNIVRLAQRHRQWKSRLDRLNQNVAVGSRLLTQDRTAYRHLMEMEEATDIRDLEASIPTWRNLSKETKNFLRKLKIQFSSAQEGNLKMNDVIGSIESQIEDVHKNGQSESKAGRQAVAFFQGIIILLKEIESMKDQTERKTEEKLSSFFKNHKITASEKQEQSVQDLAILIEAYTGTAEINRFINDWGETIFSFLSNEIQDITLLNSNEKDRLVQALQQILHSMNQLRNLTGLLDLQFLEFTGLFIPQVIFPEEGRDISDLSEEEKLLFTQTSRQAVYDGHIPIYVSKWFKDYYISHNYERVNTFLSYAESVQKYLQAIKDQLQSQYKEKSIKAFIDTIEQSLSSVQVTPSLQTLISDMLGDLAAIISFQVGELKRVC